MADTSWEESQKNGPRSRLLLWLLIVLIVGSVAGIILYNNRDFLKDFSAPGSGRAAREVFSPGAVAGDQSVIDEKHVAGVGTTTVKSGHSDVFRDSVTIANILCRTMDRDDLRIRLSIGLHFSDAERRSEIMARREVIAVMAQKTLKTRALDDIKIERIKPLLLREINTVFETGVFNDISIHTIAVEKVSNE